MIFKSLTIILGLVVIAECGYFALRRPTNRFQPVGGYQGFLALDTRDGRLCSTMPGKEAPSVYKKQADKETDENLKADLSALAMVPTCWSIR